MKKKISSWWWIQELFPQLKDAITQIYHRPTLEIALWIRPSGLPSKPLKGWSFRQASGPWKRRCDWEKAVGFGRESKIPKYFLKYSENFSKNSGDCIIFLKISDHGHSRQSNKLNRQRDTHLGLHRVFRYLDRQ